MGAYGAWDGYLYTGYEGLGWRLKALGVQPPLGGFLAGANPNMRKQKLT